MLYNDYFSDDPTYNAKDFRRRYRIIKKIVDVVRAYDDYFVLKKDCTGTVDFSSIQKYITAIRTIAYGTPGDAKDEYIRIKDSTTISPCTCFARQW
jgi:hypothetical protein